MIQERAQSEETLRMTVGMLENSLFLRSLRKTSSDTLTEAIQHIIAQHTAVLKGLLHSQDELMNLLHEERQSKLREMRVARLLNLQLAITERRLHDAKNRDTQGNLKTDKRKFSNVEE